jgi:hypothetical protein
MMLLLLQKEMEVPSLKAKGWHQLEMQGQGFLNK